ncbi:MAG: hypothetical protein AB8B94_12070 [Hyphomicrobiales bacterium]
MFDEGRIGHTGDPGVDAYAELSQYVPVLGIESIMLVNGETGVLECFWAKPNRGVRVLNFEAVIARYFDQFERLLKSAETWLSLPREQRQSISWTDPSDDRIKGYKIRKCVALYTTSEASQPKFPVDSEFLRFKEYAYQRIVGRSIFSRACFQIGKSHPKELFDRFFGPLFFRQSTEIDCFTWPWQSLAERRRNIGTVTLVFDVRMSTLAYMHTSEKVEFIQFINRVKQLAKRRVIEYGGVFSMDTGDGIVGHFCDEVSGLYQSSATCRGDMYADGIKCACAIVSDLKPYFLEYKSKMDHLLDGLAPSIGLHFSDAHWVNVDGACEAVGDNVIWAHRICSVAAGETVLYSQAVERGLEKARGLGIELPRSKKVSKKLGDIPEKGRWVGYQVKP